MNLLKNRISAPLLLVILPLLLAGLALGAYLLNRYVAQAFYANYQAGLRSEIVTVERALEYAFLNRDFDLVQDVVTNLSFQGDLHLIRVLDQEGRILASTAPNETGILLDLNSQPCQSCHTGQTLTPFSIKQTPTHSLGPPVIVTAKALDNKVACQACHSQDGPSLGLILVDRDTAWLDAQLARLSAGIYGGTGLLWLLLAAGLGFGLVRRVDQPLQALAGAPVPAGLLDSPHALGQVARRLQALEAANLQKQELLDTQQRNFNAMKTLAESIDVTLTAEKVLQFSIGKVQEVTGFAAVTMRLLEPDHQVFRMVAQSGMTPQMVKDLLAIPVEIGFTGDVYRTHRAAYTSDLSGDPRLESPSPVEGGFRSLCSVPFLSGNRLMGTMELATKEPHAWSETEVRWLELMGRSIGTVLHQIQISTELQGLAVMEERSRIAQEIHDGLAQLVGTLRVWAEEAQFDLQDHDLKKVEEDLQKIELTARDAYAGLREEMLGLRDTLVPGKGILSVIQEFLIRYKRQWGFEAQLVCQQEQLFIHGQSPITPAAEIQLLRIIQEGLANVRRHAAASRVIVRMIEDGEWLRVEIEDNGHGFDLHSVPDEKLGLRIMRERVSSVGGRLSVESQPGEGTRISVHLPKHNPLRQGWPAALERN